MSLGRLLTAGRSLMGVQSDASPYRMRKNNLLPKFGSGENPFSVADTVAAKPDELLASGTSLPREIQNAAESLPASRASECERSVEEHAEGQDACAAHGTPATPPESDSQDAVPLQDPAATDKPTKADTSHAAARLGWKNLNPVRWFKKTKPVERPVTPRYGNKVVQGEFSLDHVKVVRNDLSESDVEVVETRKQALKPTLKPVAQPTDTPELLKF